MIDLSPDFNAAIDALRDRVGILNDIADGDYVGDELPDDTALAIRREAALIHGLAFVIEKAVNAIRNGAALCICAALSLVASVSCASDAARFLAISNASQVVWLSVSVPTNNTAWFLQVADTTPDGWMAAGSADAGRCYTFFRLSQVQPFYADWKARFNALHRAGEKLDPVFCNWEVLEGRETSADYDPIKCLREYRDTYRALRNDWGLE